MQHTLTVEAGDAGARVDVFVSGKLSEISRSRVQKLIDAGQVLVNGEAKPARHHLHAGDSIVVDVPPPKPAEPQPQEIPLEVLFEDKHLLVLNKPAGLVVHPGAGTPDGTIVNALLARPGAVSSIGGVERPGIVHRLDKDTSGLMLIAKTDATHLALSRALAERRIKRVYRAIALRKFEKMQGKVDAPLGRHPTQRTKMMVNSPAGTRDALTHWKVIEQFRGLALIECRLETGRTHQIRVHMAHDKHPILGDEVYGGTTALTMQVIAQRSSKLKAVLSRVKRQMLHARQIAFVHPITDEQMQFEAEEPEDFQEVLTALREDAASA